MFSEDPSSSVPAALGGQEDHFLSAGGLIPVVVLKIFLCLKHLLVLRTKFPQNPLYFV